MKTAKCQNGNTVDQWYDRYTRSWVTQTNDPFGNQIGNADYDGEKVSAGFSFSARVKANGGHADINVLQVRSATTGFVFVTGAAGMKDVKFVMNESGDVYEVYLIRCDGVGSGNIGEARYKVGKLIGRGKAAIGGCRPAH